MRFALKKTVPFTNLGRKSDKYKNRARDMIEKITFHMLHVPSKPPQSWSADFLQNYPLFTSNAGLNLIEGPSNKTLVAGPCCVFVFKYVNGLIDFNFDTKRNYDIHSYNTRGKTNFYLPRIRHNYGKQRLLYQGLVDWNKLDKSM